MLVLLDHDDGLRLVLTQRAPHLLKHPGQISFPGGRAEAEDTDLLDTARRETAEEIGPDLARSDVIAACRATPPALALTLHPSWPSCRHHRPGPAGQRGGCRIRGAARQLSAV